MVRTASVYIRPSTGVSGRGRENTIWPPAGTADHLFHNTSLQVGASIGFTENILLMKIMFYPKQCIVPQNLISFPCCTFLLFVWWGLSPAEIILFVFTRSDNDLTIITLFYWIKIDHVLLQMIMIDIWGTVNVCLLLLFSVNKLVCVFVILYLLSITINIIVFMQTIINTNMSVLRFCMALFFCYENGYIVNDSYTIIYHHIKTSLKTSFCNWKVIGL